MRYIKKIILIALVLFSIGCKTPELDYRTLGNKVRVSTLEGNAYAELGISEVRHPKKDRYYSWYNKGVIGSTQGGYSGKILNGKYTSWYAINKQLNEQGTYRNGLKDGLWMSWEQDGSIKAQQKWSEGRLIVPKAKVGFKSWFIRIPKKLTGLFKYKKRDSI